MASNKKQRTPRSKITYSEMDLDFEEMENEMLKMRKDMTQMITRMRELRRKYRKCIQLKVEQKKRNSSESSDINTKVSISEELSHFIGKDKNIDISCGEIILAFNNYIKTNNLQDSKNPLNIKISYFGDLKFKDYYFNHNKFMNIISHKEFIKII